MSYFFNRFLFNDSRVFISIWDTTLTASGTTDANTIQLPISASNMFGLVVDWGDGTIDSSNTHTYEVGGVKIVKIKGQIRNFAFNLTNEGIDKRKIREITSWGEFVVDGSAKFHSCINLNLANVQGTPVIEVYNLTSMFQGCTQLRAVSGIERWNFLPNTNLFRFFYSCSLLNSSLIGQMKMNNVQSISQMCGNTPQLNISFGDWDVSNVKTANNFKENATSANYSAANLDATYNGWASQILQSGVSISFGSAKHTSASQASRDILTNTYNWTITDGGI